MKLQLFAILAAVFLILPLTLNADGSINVTVDGYPITFEGQGPVNIDGRILVPVRGVFEHLGFTPTWSSTDRAATLTRHDFTIVLTIDSHVFTTNGTRFYLDVPAQIIGGSTMLPIRFVLESVGYDLSWDSATRTVQITTDNPTPPDLPQYVVRDDSPGISIVVPQSPEDETNAFLDFIAELTHGIIADYTTDTDRLRAIYRFIVLNFNCFNGRDCPVVDGGMRPTNVPPTTMFHRVGDQLEMLRMPAHVTFADIFSGTDAGRHFINILSAWELLLYGDGICENFVGLLTLMAQSLGFEAVSIGGCCSYLVHDGLQDHHTWAAIRVGQRWYFFDPMMEAINRTSSTDGHTTAPFYWFMQYANDPLTQSRYVWDESEYGDFR